MQRFRSLFGDKRGAVIGMIHVGALPGTPLYEGSMAKLIDTCCREAEIYKKCNLDGVMIENMHDIPYVRSRDIGPEIVSSMTKICSEVRKLMPAKTPCGVQVLAGGNKEALAVAKASSLQFIRAEGYVFSHVADEGLIEASAGQLLRYRKYINAEEVLIFSDIKKKHSSHAITSDVSIEETAKAAEFFLSDGVIITGLATGCPADIQQVESVKRIVGIPVIIGSGVDSKNFKNYIQADGFIIGSYFKKFGSWKSEVDEDKVRLFMEKMFQLRLIK